LGSNVQVLGVLVRLIRQAPTLLEPGSDNGPGAKEGTSQ
jgi:hypothetical protein